MVYNGIGKARKHENPCLKVRNLTAQLKFSGNQNSDFLSN